MRKCIVCGEEAEFTVQRSGEEPLHYCGLHMLLYCLEFIEGWIRADIEQIIGKPVLCVCHSCGYPHVDWRKVRRDE